MLNEHKTSQSVLKFYTCEINFLDEKIVFLLMEDHMHRVDIIKFQFYSKFFIRITGKSEFHF